MADDYGIFVDNEFDDATFVLTSGEGSDAAKEVKPKYFRENLQALMRAYYFFRHAPGADLSINAGASNDNQLSIDVDPAKLVQAGHQVLIYNADASKIWLDTAATDDNVVITNAKLIKGSDVSDYDTDITDVSSYTALVVGKENSLFTIGKDGIATGAAPGAFNADDLPMTNTDTDKVQAVVDAIEDTLDNLTDYNKTTRTAGTALAADVVTATSVDDDDVYTGDGFKNHFRNSGFELWLQGPNNAPNSTYWDEDSATVSQESTNKRSGDYAAKIETTATARGIVYTVPNYSFFAGKTITASGWVKEVSSGDVLIYIDDGVDNTTGTAVTVSSSWQQVSCTHEVNSGATQLKIYVRSSGGGTDWYLDDMMLTLGATVKTYDTSVWDDIAEDDVIPVNWLLNPGFENFDEFGTATVDNGFDRDYWVKYGLGNVEVASLTSGTLAGIRSMIIQNFGANSGVKQDIGDLAVVSTALKGKTVCFSAWFKVPSSSGASETWKIEIYDGATTTYTEFEADALTADTWTQIAVVANLRSNMSTGDLVVRIYAVDAENAVMHVDGACLNVGSRPAPGAGFSEAKAWTPERYVFQYTGELAGDAYAGLWQPVVRTFYPTKLDVYCGQGAGCALSGQADYTLHSGIYGSGESADNLSCTLAAAAAPDADGKGGGSTQTLANANTDKTAYSKYIRIYQDLTTTNDNPEDITVILTGWSVAV